ncbi:EAL domain-containing protein [Shewanella sp. Scap07]|uniref:EAL domain-containing protein n=1 Tax=Shewanella sp. Scap07 TaxID=2589987 RepID=UPI0015B7A776|nr:EAL domain-containing protein [Shewanella sp. Scap07]QLE85052.1 EAL domain-containing protein [Shewanella sp. Scap07]
MPNALLKLVLTLFITCLSLTVARAHDSITHSVELNSDNFSVPQGLSQSTVTSIVEDEQGYVWIGTLNGLNRFDGKSFTRIKSHHSGSLSSTFIRSLYYSNNHGLLIGTDKGLYVFDPVNEHFQQLVPQNTLLTQAIWSINENETGQLFITLPTELLVLNADLTVSFHDTKPTAKEIKKTIIKNNIIYTRNYDGELHSIDIKNSGKTQKLVDNVIDIIELNDKIVFSTASGISVIESDTTSSIVALESPHLSEANGVVYAVNKNGIYSVDGNNLEIVGQFKHNIAERKISSFYRSQNGFYIGFNNQGFQLILDERNLVQQITAEVNNTWSITPYKEEQILVASDQPTINRYDRNLKLTAKYDSGIIGFKNAIELNGDIYIGSYEGLIKISPNNEKNQILEDTIVTVLAKHKNKIYLGSYDGQVSVIDNEQYEFTIDTLVQEPILDIFATEKATYIASQSGFYEYHNNSLRKIHDEITYSVSQLGNNIVFGTATSIMQYDPNGKVSTLFSNNKEIYALVGVNNSLVASSLGEVVYLKDNTPFVLPTAYGSQYEYNTPSKLVLDASTVLLGGIDGISLFNIDKLNQHVENKKVINTLIEEALVFNVPVAVGSEFIEQSMMSTSQIQLKYSDYPFTFKFSSPSASAQDIEYFYQMSGLNEDWISGKKTHSATYTNLSDGEYIFNVYAIDPLTKQQGPIRSLQVLISPPWWLSTTSKVIYSLCTLILLGFTFKAALRRREVQRQIAKSEERLKLSLWGSGDEMWDWDIETGQIYRSNIWGSLEFPRDGQRSGDGSEESNIHPMDQERVSSALNKHFTGECDHFEAAYRVKGKADEWVWILDRAKIVERDEQDKPVRMTGTIKNINNFKQAEEQLRLFERAIENISEGMFILDSQFDFVEVNEACCDLCEKSRSDFIGTKLNFDLYPDSYSEQIHAILQQQGSWSNDVESSKGDGSSFLMELTIDAIYDEQGALSHYVGVFSDISRRKQQEEELRKLTNNDLLTSLPNRSSLMVTLGNLVRKDTHHTLMVLDLDNFKKINDSLGHQVGDELLKMVALRIEAAVPYHTSIYRLGGDEFAILVDNNPDIGSAAVIANSVIDAFNNPFDLSNDRVVVGVSIGIVLYPEDDQNEQALLRKADIAMYHAKSGGGNRYQFYSESLNRNAIRQLEVENLIREGLKEDLFEVYYQPKIDLKSGKLAGMEALVRLNHPQHGLIPPGDFIPLAEETGLIIDIGEVVLKKACFAAQNWRRQGIFNGRVAVNLSSQQFALPDLHQRIESILRLTQLPASNLELEITEGTVIKQPEKAIKVMDQLSQMGVSLALDDFGTGYSSLSYLKRFPIHTLKIDKAFVDDIDKSDRDLKMVDSIITIAHNMGLSVVGEGVEEASQLSILKALKCEEIQGFIYSKAVTEECFSKLLIQENIEPQKHVKQANSGPKM